MGHIAINNKISHQLKIGSKNVNTIEINGKTCTLRVPVKAFLDADEGDKANASDTHEQEFVKLDIPGNIIGNAEYQIPSDWSSVKYSIHFATNFQSTNGTNNWIDQTYTGFINRGSETYDMILETNSTGKNNWYKLHLDWTDSVSIKIKLQYHYWANSAFHSTNWGWDDINATGFFTGI